MNPLKQQLYDVISGKSTVSHGGVIQAIACYLGEGPSSGEATEQTKHFKKQEAQKIEDYASQNQLWVSTIDFSNYISEGAEQKVYLNPPEHVLKLNDSIYYSTWKVYFFSLLCHNFFFPDTAYELVGFVKDQEIL